MRKMQVLVAVSFVLLPAFAAASHYDLSSIDLVGEGTLKRLGQLGIYTTEHLWDATRTTRRLVRLSRKVKVRRSQLRDWRDFCDVLHIQGAGPKVVRALRMAGVRRLLQMARQDPNVLLDRIRKVNKKHGFLGKLPGPVLLEDWIDQAGRIVAKRRGRN